MLPYPLKPPPQKYMWIPSTLSACCFNRGNLAARVSKVFCISVRSSVFVSWAVLVELSASVSFAAPNGIPILVSM